MVYHGDASDHAGREVLTWEGVGEAADDLALQVHESGFRPSVIIAIARGGMIPAGALTYRLGVKLTDAINVEFYTDVEQTLPIRFFWPPCWTPNPSQAGSFSWWTMLRTRGAPSHWW